MGCDDTFNHLVFSPFKKQDIWRFITYHYLHSGSTHLFLNVFLQVSYTHYNCIREMTFNEIKINTKNVDQRVKNKKKHKTREDEKSQSVGSVNGSMV